MRACVRSARTRWTRLLWGGWLLCAVGVWAAPEVARVEPPGWWLGHSLNPVRLHLRGANLTGARVEFDGEGLEVGSVRVSPAGTSLFADVRIGGEAAVGPARLKVLGPGGEVAEAVFELLEPLGREGRFRGVGPDDVVYLILTDRFANGDPTNDNPEVAPGLTDRTKPRFYHGGDFQGVLDRLPYLQELGVTALWLTPWYDNVNHLNRRERYTADNRLAAEGDPVTDYHGYGAVDFYGVDEHFGTLAKLRELVGAAQARGMKVIQDQVANHTGPYHSWVDDPPTLTWFNGTREAHLANTWQTWTLPDPYAPPSLQRSTLEGWFIDLLPDLNQNDPECARYLIQNSLWWVGVLGLDAIRQDTLPYVPRTFWRDWTLALKREYGDLNVIGEMFDGDAAKVSFFQGGRERFDGVDSGIGWLFDFPLYYPVRRVFAGGQSMQQLAEQLGRDHLYVNAEGLVTFLGLHDVGRFMSEKGATLEGLQLAFTFLFTTRGTPLIYYGDEVAMRGGTDPDNRRDFPGGWPGDPQNAFTAAGRTPEQQAVFGHVSQLARLRREHEVLRRGRLMHLEVGDSVYVYARVSEGRRMVVALNNSVEPQEVAVDLSPLGLRSAPAFELRFGQGEVKEVSETRVNLELPARAGGVFQLSEGAE
jgi:neopullulanase